MESKGEKLNVIQIQHLLKLNSFTTEDDSWELEFKYNTC